MQKPTLNAVTQGKHGTYNAVDYSAAPDPNIHAPEDGTIVSYAYNGNCGNNLQMNGANGRHGFCHLESTNVKVGQAVKRGQVIGIMGYTGYTIPTGPAGRHLHWVLNKGGTYVYPPDYVNESFIKQGTGGNDMVFTNEAQLKPYYMMLRGNEGTLAERQSWVGVERDRFPVVALPEANNYRKQLDDVRKALKTLQDQPPKEVIKEVIKIVEKPVEVIKEIPVEIIKEVPVEADEKTVVEGWFKKLWERLFK